MEAAAWLGWGRNTLTRKIQELGLEAELRKGERQTTGADAFARIIGSAPGALQRSARPFPR